MINNKGFTLIEILVTLGIVSVIFGMVATAAAGIGRKSRDQQRINDLLNVQSVLSQYYADQHFYPSTKGANALSKNWVANTPLQDQTGNPATIANPKTYLNSLPMDSSTSNGYCYSSQTSVQNSADCTNNISNNENTCQWYSICATMEDSKDGNIIAGSCPCSTTANYMLSPQN